jgi:hypothetical protein
MYRNESNIYLNFPFAAITMVISKQLLLFKNVFEAPELE